MNEKELIERIKKFFRENRFNTWEKRKEAEAFLKALGFDLWANTWRPNNKEINGDEEIWGLEIKDENGRNGKLLLLINWIDGIVWIYTRTTWGRVG